MDRCAAVLEFGPRHVNGSDRLSAKAPQLDVRIAFRSAVLFQWTEQSPHAHHAIHISWISHRSHELRADTVGKFFFVPVRYDGENCGVCVCLTFFVEPASAVYEH